MKKLILSGGGDEKDSKPLDELFLDLILPGKKLLYIPIAWKSGDFESCQKWFTSTFSAFGFTDIQMWTDLSCKNYENLELFGGIYIGGGNTYSLLHRLRISKFDDLLKKFIESGRPVYGGSAGAIVFGKNIGTAAFGSDADDNQVGLQDLSGFNFVKGFSVQCHYLHEQDTQLLEYSRANNLPVIALSERSGLYVVDSEIRVKGFEPAHVFEKGKKREIGINSVIN